MEPPPCNVKFYCNCTKYKNQREELSCWVHSLFQLVGSKLYYIRIACSKCLWRFTCSLQTIWMRGHEICVAGLCIFKILWLDLHIFNLITRHVIHCSLTVLAYLIWALSSIIRVYTLYILLKNKHCLHVTTDTLVSVYASFSKQIRIYLYCMLINSFRKYIGTYTLIQRPMCA